MAGIEHRHWSATSDPNGLCPDLPDLSLREQLSETRTSGGLTVQAGALGRK